MARVWIVHLKIVKCIYSLVDRENDPFYNAKKCKKSQVTKTKINNILVY